MSDQEVISSVVPVVSAAPAESSNCASTATGKKKVAVQRKSAPKPAKVAASKPKAKTATKASIAAATAAHPKYLDMVVEGIKTLNERSGSSKQALLKFISLTFKIDEKVCNQHLKLALKSGVKSGALKQVSGLGASGSFKLGEAKKKQPQAKPEQQQEAKSAKSVPAKAVAKKTPVVKAAKKAPVKIQLAVKPKAKQSPVAKKPAVVAKKPAKKPAPAKVVAKKPVVKKVLTKEAAKAKLPSSPTKGRRAPAQRKQPAKRAAAPKTKPINIVV